MSSSSSTASAEAPSAAARAWPGLRASGLQDLLSSRGRSAVLGEGIRAWVERARGADVDATIGVLAGSRVELAQAHGAPAAEGGLAVGGQADPAAVIWWLSAVREHLPRLDPAEIFPYAPVPGLRAFRQAWRGWMLRKSAGVDDPERVRRLTTPPLATPGVSGALFTAGHLLLDPGEAVVVADKRWDGYDTTFDVVLGARLVAHRLLTADGRLDLDDLEERLAETAARQAKVTVVLNFPNNPTGYVPSEEEAAELRARIRAVAERTGRPVVVLFDDAYEGFVYDESYPVSLFYSFLGLHPHVHPVKCDGITKELLFWGGRLGALTLGLTEEAAEAEWRGALEAEWENKCSAVLRAIVSSASTPVQALVAHLLEERLDDALAERERMVRLLRGRCEALRDLLDRPHARAAFRSDPFNGGLFAFLNLRHGSAADVALRALHEHRVGVVPMEIPADGINALRVTFGSVPAERLERLVDALVASAGT
jgi:aspartate/methionine/tyrosine aminotransferase